MNAREVTSDTSPSATVRTFSFAESHLRRKRCVYPTTASTPDFLMASSTRCESASSVANGFSMSKERRLSTAARIGSTCRCSSVEMMAAVTSGLFNNSLKSEVTKSALHLSPTSLARSGLRSATPMKSTCGWRAATSPRNRPTRPAPIIARPILLGDLRNGAQRRLERQGDGLVALGGEVGGHVDLHHHARVLGLHHHLAVVHHCFEEVHRLRRHRPGVGVLDELAGHGRHRQLHALLHRVDDDVLVAVVHHHRALGADHLDPGGGAVLIAEPQGAGAADHHRHAVCHGHPPPPPAP